jgi:hypothetical protein
MPVYIIGDESVNTDFLQLFGLFNAAVYLRRLLSAQWYDRLLMLTTKNGDVTYCDVETRC